jgi:hypothetical protein
MLRGVETDDLAHVHVVLEGGTRVRPSRFDDHPVDLAESGADNVLDLCLDTDEPALTIHVEAAAFMDVAGRPGKEVLVGVTRPTRAR